MTRAQIEEVLYEGLISLEDPSQRQGFLDETCRGNPEMRARLEELVSMHDEAEDFFGITLDASCASLPEPDSGESLEVIGTRIGRYLLLERLGEGGCGAVYLAEQLEPVRRRVALKIIRVGMDTDQIIARFEMERQALALMDHPNIARVLDAGATASGRPYFVMQMVEGLRITDFCDRHRLDLRARLRLFIPVCMAIQHAHQKGVIHCDIKPANVLVTLHDGKAVPKVIDFGIAKAAEGVAHDLSASATAPLIGTPVYMSPEQVDGNGLDVDTRSDIYSLGVLLHELLAGRPPRDPERFRHASVEDIRHMLRDAPIPKPSERFRQCPAGKATEIAAARKIDAGGLMRTLDGDLDAVVAKAMDPDRHRRYATASELAADISRFLENEPVTARRAGGAYRLGKLVQRNKIAFVAGSIVVMALSAGFGVSTWLFLRESLARQEQARLRNAAETARANEVKLRESAQAGETVAHAAVLISHGDIAAADSLLAGLEPSKVPASLEAATTFRTVGEWLLHEGRWEEASKRFAAVAQAISRVDKSHSERITIEFVSAAAAVSDSGNSEHFEQLRMIAAEQFSNATDPVVADEVLKSCLIKPAGPELLAKLEPLLGVLEDRLPWERPDSPDQLMQAWQMLSLALGHFRKGDFKRSEDWARRCLQHPNTNPSRVAAVRILLAMALYRQGSLEEARAELVYAHEEVLAHFRKPFSLGSSSEGFWFDWVIARILIKEADELIPR